MIEYCAPAPTDPGDASASPESIGQAFSTIASLYELRPDMLSPLDTPQSRELLTPRELLLNYQADIASALSLLEKAAREKNPGYRMWGSHGEYIWSDGTPSDASSPGYVDIGEQRLYKWHLSIRAEETDHHISLRSREEPTMVFGSEDSLYEIWIPKATTTEAINKSLKHESPNWYSAHEPNSYDESLHTGTEQCSLLSNGGVVVRSINDWRSNRNGYGYIFGPDGRVTYRPFVGESAPGAQRYLEIERQLVARYLRCLPQEMRDSMPPEILAIAEMPPRFITSDEKVHPTHHSPYRSDTVSALFDIATRSRPVPRAS